MEDQETPHPDYLKGFNEGYLISKYLPDFGNKVFKGNSETPRSQGFQDGHQQALTETKTKIYPKWLKPDKSNSIENSSGEKNVNRDDYEPDV